MDDAPGRATLYARANVLTLDPKRPRAEALATLDERILALGSEAECREALRAAGAHDAERIDLAGRTLLPGFIDTHLHPIAVVYFDLNADLRGARSIADVQATVRSAAARTRAGEWVVGLQLEDESLAESRLPTRQEIDAACAEHPVVLMEHDGHSAVGNTRALEAAGIDKSTPDLPDGRIARESDGTPSGACYEGAARILVGAVPSPSLESMRATARRSFARLAAHGITSAGVVLQTDEEGPGGAAGSAESLAMQLLLDEAPFSPYSIVIGRTVDAAVALRESALHDPKRGRRVGGFKIFADGTFGSCTARMREPFSDRPGECGMMTLGDAEILSRMRAAETAGLQVCVHAIGDAAVERCVGLFEQLLGERPRADHRHRIEHASLIPPEVLPRIAELGLCVSTQPLFIHSEKGWLHRRLGVERSRHVYPLRSLLDAGVVVGGASDAPVESTDVLHAIACCVTREGFEPQQGLTPLEALRLFTRDAAHLQFEENEKGTLEVGKRADLVVVSGDPLAVPPEKLGGLRVLRTIVAGRTVHDADGASA